MVLRPDQVVDETESTNDLAKQLGREGAPAGAWISARRQTSGRGRLGRRWESFEGNLFLSMIARGVPRPSLTWIPLAAGVGAARAVAKVSTDFRVTLKWPNDLLVDDAKLGGILCEASEDFVIVGIGINCLIAPEGLDQTVTCLTREAGREVNADELRPILVDELRQVFGELVISGWRAIADEYESRSSLTSGTQIEWAGNRGRVLGLGPLGELRVRKSDGREAKLFAEDVQAVREAPRASDEFPA